MIHISVFIIVFDFFYFQINIFNSYRFSNPKQFRHRINESFYICKPVFTKSLVILDYKIYWIRFVSDLRMFPCFRMWIFCATAWNNADPDECQLSGSCKCCQHSQYIYKYKERKSKLFLFGSDNWMQNSKAWNVCISIYYRLIWSSPGCHYWDSPVFPCWIT